MNRQGDMGRRRAIKSALLCTFGAGLASNPFQSIASESPIERKTGVRLVRDEWYRSEVVAPETYWNNKGVSIDNYEKTRAQEFRAGDVLSIDDLILAKIEVAALIMFAS